MVTVVGSTRQRIAEASSLIEKNQMNLATLTLNKIIDEISSDALQLVSLELRDLISRMLPKRRRDLLINLENGLKRNKFSSDIELKIVDDLTNSPAVNVSRCQIYEERLLELRKRHIFQWGTFYRQNLTFMFDDLLVSSRLSERWHVELESISGVFSNHARDIYGHGYRRSVEKGLSVDVAETKAVNGLQHFIYLVIGLYLDRRDNISCSRDAHQIWQIASCFIVGILRGYGNTSFGVETGWALLGRYSKIWLPALGFTRGSDALNLLNDFPIQDRMSDAYVTIIPALLGIEKLANHFHGSDFLLPRHCRLSIGSPPRWDITVNVREGESIRDLLLSCFFENKIVDSLSLSEAVSLRASVVIGRLGGSSVADDSVISEKVLDASDIDISSEQVYDFSEMVLAKLEEQGLADAAVEITSSLKRNYAKDFPLEDPEFRRLFLVERYSVKRLLEEMDDRTGVHLWCSVRRSGKTTAAGDLSEMTNRSILVFQTMDHQPNHPEQNIFERKVREALDNRKAIAGDFFQRVVDECILSNVSVESGEKKIVFILDEYETLFGLISAYTSEDTGLRYLVAQPLLSQMVAFSTKNLLIFMGQRPDAYLILSSQNQLSPLVRQHNFPLFGHIGSTSISEFSQLLRRVLTERLQYKQDFADAVYEETSGHPYLTVNLMVDFCDWLIASHAKENHEELDATHFIAFSKDRLTPAALRKSPYYSFFHGMLGEYLSESSRKAEPWLYCITSILKEISVRHPKVFGCSIANFHVIAAPLGQIAQMPSDRLLTSAAMANFLKIQGGQVFPGIRLMARLAQSTTRKIN
ncbi:hypothetical protein [Janthinobacterium rivuli]|uniref:hypothetical protein n=1 Tax=Janthinobacterium rivuli TaxID=2751478 RepID=UPI00383B3AC6